MYNLRYGPWERTEGVEPDATGYYLYRRKVWETGRDSSGEKCGQWTWEFQRSKRLNPGPGELISGRIAGGI
jgi:hypothetical protein